MPSPLRSLSARLLVLTIGFVMLAEVFIYAPSVAAYRYNYLQNRLADSHIAALALLATPDNMVGEVLTAELLNHAGAYVVGLERENGSKLILQGQYVLVGMSAPDDTVERDETPVMADVTIQLGQVGFFGLILDAFATLWHSENRLLHVIAPSPNMPSDVVDILIDEAPMRAEMIDFSERILGLSIMISLFTATLVFFSLHLLMVRPMRRISESMVAFRENPEEASIVHPSMRSDEVGVVERELIAMQLAIRDSLTQKTHLAALGTAVGKISHDLRNMLTTARLVSDRLAESDDPQVRHASPRLVSALDRAVDLCSRTLDFTRDGTPRLDPRHFALAPMLDDVRSDLLPDGTGIVWEIESDSIAVYADRSQFYRVIANIALNALQAGATLIAMSARDTGERIEIDIRDNGPGLPPRARENLFQPFAASTRPGGSGLGLAITREIMRAHGGDVTLLHASARGTAFRLVLPAAPVRRGVAQRQPTH
jgi:signal transduction histidine kinase